MYTQALSGWDTAINATKATAAVATDPHLSEVICHVLNLQRIEAGKKPGVCKPIPVNYKPAAGVGLRDVVVPLRYYVKAKQHPIAAKAAVVAVLSGLVLLGYVLGKEY
jgi:hypothetical protein